MCIPSLTGSRSSSESAVKLTLCLCGSLGAQLMDPAEVKLWLLSVYKLHC